MKISNLKNKQLNIELTALFILSAVLVFKNKKGVITEKLLQPFELKNLNTLVVNICSCAIFIEIIHLADCLP